MKPSDISSQCRPLSLLSAALAALGLVSAAHAQVQTAGELFVNIDATTQPEGALSSITNNGTLGGFFEARIGGDTVPTIAAFNPSGVNVTKGIRFDGGDAMQLVGSLGGALTPPPAGLVGINPTRSVEVWAMNPSLAQEEAMVSWGKRGACGSNMSFNYGNDFRWGGLAQWCGRDMGWKNTIEAPHVKRWHHLVYTYDGTTSRLYADGVLWNSEGVVDGDVNTAPNTSINLAIQLEPDGVTPNFGVGGALTIARVRIHEEVLTDLQILSNYNFEKGDFPNELSSEQLSSPPNHRYSFNEPITSDAANLGFVDSIGGANGTVLGNNAQFNGTRLVLPGGPPATGAYGDLPNGLLSSRSVNNGGSGEITIEGWVRITGSVNWSRIFDFGSAVEGEVFGPGGLGTAGSDFFFYSAQIGGNTAEHRIDIVNDQDDPLPTIGGGVSIASPGTFGNDLHFVVSWKESTGEVRIYENGVEIDAMNTPVTSMSDLNDVNNWLGRSNFTFDNTTAMELDEFRIYSRILSPGEVLGNFAAGPNTINDGSAVPVTLVDEPDSITVFESYPARFAVATAGTAPISYQWRRGGSPITGATNAFYTFVPVLADNNAQFSCTVSNNTGTPNVLTSSNAVLTVSTQALTMKHRYSFNETSGTSAEDSVSGAHGELRDGSSFNGTGQLVLDGATGYVNLPNDLVTNFTNITFEVWVTDTGSGMWSRIFDFGNSSAGEDFPALPGPFGVQHLYLTHPSEPGPVRSTISIDSNAGDQNVVGVPLPLNQVKHIVMILNGPMRTGRLLVDGVQVGENTGITLTPASLGSTVNNWIGRGQYGGDPFFNGRYDEFRIWDGAMTPAQAAASFVAGPNPGEVVASLQITISAPNQITASWPASATGYILEQTSSLQTTDTVWTEVTSPAPTPNGDRLEVTLPIGAGNQFLRLSKP